MTDIKPIFFLVTFDKLLDKVVNNLSQSERNNIVCYNVQKKVDKKISPKITQIVNEWELPWNDYSFQSKQYYEYGVMIHLLKNPQLIKDTTHIGLMHYDMLFLKNSINEMTNHLKNTPKTIFYQQRRPNNQTSLNKFEISRLCELMQNYMNIPIDVSSGWDGGWVSECLSLTPKDVFLRFADFLFNNHLQIEEILKTNRWGIMNLCPHRICGIIERMWGFYLAGIGLPLKQMNVLHDWDSYEHHHMEMNGTGLTNI